MILEKAVEPTTSDYCTDPSRVFDDFLLHRMGDTISIKNHQKLLRDQHISHARYDSTAFSRMIRQNGATLAITLILLFIVTLLGVSAMQVTQIQEKMSSNLQDKELSFNAAESALASGETWLLGQDRQPSVQATCSPYPCVLSMYQNLNYTTQASSWWNTHSAAYDAALDNIATPPRYFVEFQQFVPDSPIVGDSSLKSTGVFYYQVTSRGSGSSDTSTSILQTTISRRY